MEDLSGKQFGHYQIVAPLGEGGMAAVYKAYQPSMERHVAVKVLPRHMATSEEFVARFKREAKLLAQLQHPHILPVFDYGESEGYPYIVMSFVQSGTLADLMKKQRLPMSEVRRIITQTGDALGYAHARGMIHRDIKPSNILIDERGNCLLTDFGLARMAESSAKITSSGAIMGTPAYMAPEQGSGSNVDHRSDLYALGVILYELVTGRVPYTAETPIAIVFKHISDPLPSARKLNPMLSEAVELVLYKALAKNPDDRYQTAESFVQGFQAAISDDAKKEQPKIQHPVVEQVAASIPSSVESLPTMQPVGATIKTTAPTKKSPALPLWIFGLMGVLILGAIAFVALKGLGTRSNSVTPTQPIVNTEPVTAPEIVMTSTQLPVQNIFELTNGAKFTDEFDGQLADGWDWVAEDPLRWSLSEVPGSLQIIASDASLDGPTSPTNILFRSIEAQDFEAITRLHFQPKSNFQLAGLIVFQDGNNVLQFGRGFCDIQDQCVGNGLYFDNIEESVFALNNFRTAVTADDIFLKIRRSRNLYIAYYSADGENWTEIGKHERDFTSVTVGLIAAQAPEPIAAQFDSFTLIEYPAITSNNDMACFESPAENAAILYELKKGENVSVVAASEDDQWLSIQKPDDINVTCWVAFEGDLGVNADIIPRITP